MRVDFCRTQKEHAVFGFLTFLLVLPVAPDPAETSTSVTPEQFRAWFDAARERKLEIPDEVKRAARRYRYVFISGFHNERMPGYFAHNAKQLRARTIPKRSVHFIAPSSEKTVAENARAVRSEFREIARRGPERLVVIAHSRGACDALAFALENPEFVSDHIEALFLVQGPFGGSGLADYVVGDGPAMDSAMPWRHRLIAYLLGRLETYQLSRGKYGGLPSLTRRASKEFWEEFLDEHASAIPVVAPRTFYVTTKTPPSRLRMFLKATASYLGAYFGPNDGMVALEDQVLPGLGTVLAVLDAGHMDLTHRSASSRPKRRMQTALVDAIIMTVGEPGSDPLDEDPEAP
jgi:pimeloyl-ACP methyl ester carboxylesterase